GHIIQRDRIALDDMHAMPALDVPHSQSPIFTATEQVAAVGREGDAIHMAAMPKQCCAIATSLDIPEPDRIIQASTSHRASIGAPGHTIYRAALDSYRLYVHPGSRIPEPDGRIVPATGNRLPIGRKGQTFDDVRMPACPEQRTILQIPQFDRPIPASTGQKPF